MADLDKTKTHAYLREVLAADAQAHVRLTYFAQCAEEEGRLEAASVLRQFANQELRHAVGHLEKLAPAGDPITDQAIGHTPQNIRAMVKSTSYDVERRYKWMISIAEGEELYEIGGWLEQVLRQKSAALDSLRSI